MKHVATFLLLTLVAWGSTALAQPNRVGQDAIWVRNAPGANVTLDGQLDEAEWGQAESMVLQWNMDFALPGDGQKIEGDPAIGEPLDPNDGTFRVFRDGNVVYMSMEVNDASIGGGRALQAGNWWFDGILMSITDRSQRAETPGEQTNYFSNGATNSEWAYGWWLPSDTLEGGLPIPGVDPRAFGDYGVGFNGSINDEPTMPGVWEWAYSIDGVANDDTNGQGSPTPDNGYILEMMIDMGAMGYDFDQAGGDRAPFNVALQDADYNWPFDEDRFFVSRVWFQNQWMNNYNEGAGYLLGDPAVTVSSGVVPEFTEPEFVIPSGREFDAPTVDGMLDEDVWASFDPQFQIQYQAPLELMDANPGALAPYHFSWFRPDINGDGNAAEVVDPTVGRISLFHRDDMLYIGLDTDDAAINGQGAEGGRDGLRVTLRSLDSLASTGTLGKIQFEFSVDSTGAVRLGGAAADAGDAVQAAIGLKGASTVADPSNVDEGYQIEVAIDLVEALGYPAGLDEGQVWLGLNFFDGDALDVPANSYATRTWILSERAEGASLYGYLEPGEIVANEGDGAAPGALALAGNHPNPFATRTVLRYSLPQSGEVEVAVYDVLGRQVALVTPGAQAAGPNAVTIESAGFASGLYFYRIQLKGSDVSATGRMTVVK